MEVKFESVYVDTEEQLRELYSKIIFRKTRTWALVFVILAVICGIIWIINQRPAYLLGAGAYVCVMVWYWSIPSRRAKRRHGDALRQFDGKLPPSRLQFGDEIRYEDGEGKMTWPYRNLKQIYFLKDSIVLENQAGIFLQFPTNAFAKGTAPEWIAFMKVQCPQLNLPDGKW